MGATDELGLKPGVITGDDVLHVRLPWPHSPQTIEGLSLVIRICSQTSIRHPRHRKPASQFVLRLIV